MFFIPILFFLLLPAPFPRADLAYSIAHFGLVCKTGITKNLTVRPGFPIKLPCKSISICRALLFAFFSGLTSGLVCGAVIGVRCPIRHIVYNIFGAVYHVVHTVHDAVAHILDCVACAVYGVVYDVAVIDGSIVHGAVGGGSVIGSSVVFGVRLVGSAVVVGIATGAYAQD